MSADHPPGGVPRRGAERRGDIQGLRTVAVVAVVMFHLGSWLPGGFTGVDMFFTISGFVICGSIMREWRATGSFGFREFYWRRFRRIVPALAVVVSITVVGAALILSPFGAQQNAGLTGAAALLLSANFVIQRFTGDYFNANAEINPLVHTWTLSVEEQFYLLFPLLLFLGLWTASRRGWRAAPIAIVSAVTVVSFAVAIWSSVADTSWAPTQIVGFYSPVVRAWEFGVGALLALPALRGRRLPRPLVEVAGTIGAVLLVASLAIVSPSTPFPGLATLLPVTGVAFLIVSEGSVVNRALSLPFMVATGDRSYSIYLWHLPAIVFAVALWPDSSLALVGAVVVATILAVLSYRFVEQPMRRARVVGRRRRLRVVLTVMLPPIVLSLVLLLASSQGFWNARVIAARAAVVPLHVGQLSGCADPPASEKIPTAACHLNATSTGTPVYLVGDSNADHFSEGLIDATDRLDLPIAIRTANGCPFALVAIDRESGLPSQETCATFLENTLDWLSHAPPGVVVVGSSDRYLSDPRVAMGPNPSEMETDAGDKRAAYEHGLAEALGMLTEAGHRVLVVQTIPTFTGPFSWDPKACSFVTVLAAGCVAEMDAAAANANQAPGRRAVVAAASESGATVIDLTDDLCPGGTCSTSRGDVVVYRDALHVSAPGSHLLANRLVEILAAAIADKDPALD